MKKQSTKRLDSKHFCSCGAFVLLHSSCVTYLNAALINNFTRAINQMAMCNVKEVAHNDKPTDYYPTLRFPSALWCFLKTFFQLNDSVFTDFTVWFVHFFINPV